MDRSPRLYTIPPSAPFLPTLLHALLAGKVVPGCSGDDPTLLADATLYLPTQRACRMAREAFLDALNIDAAVLPRIVPLGDIDEDEIIFAQAATGAAARDALELPPALGTFERRALLAQLILAWTIAGRAIDSATGTSRANRLTGVLLLQLRPYSSVWTGGTIVEATSLRRYRVSAMSIFEEATPSVP